MREQKLDSEPLTLKAKDTDTEMAFAFEKEGSWLPELPAGWFELDQKYMKRALQMRARAEQKGDKENVLIKMLKGYLDTSDSQWIMAPAAVRRALTKAEWSKLSPQEQIDFLFGSGDVRKRLTKTALGHLFYQEVLNFGRMVDGPKKPESIKITDDLGSYELVSRGETDRKVFQEMRREIEEALDSPIGHQHIVHAWPADREAREKLAPKYLELLDAGTWFLFWRQMERDPEEVESILGHEYLGIYPRSSLKRLRDRMAEGDSEHARDKYRMIGFRSMRGRDSMPGQDSSKFYPDFELRSGNKGVKRDFMEDMLQARLASGDYSNLVDFDSHSVDPGAPIRKIAPDLAPEELATLEAFESEMPQLRSANRQYRKDLRNKIFSPLLRWEERLPVDLSGESFGTARRKYAEELGAIAKNYLKRKARTQKPESMEKLWEETQQKIEKAIHGFADSTQLSKAFENYLMPRPTELPDIRVATDGPVDVNQIDLGIEFSFRFLNSPANKTVAGERIYKTVGELAKALGATEVQSLEDPTAHGHGLGMKFSLVDENGKKWRVEWDGVQRFYRQGKPIAPHGGHIEIPSPKAAPQDMKQITALYETNRALGQVPSRAAGGAHINIDLNPFFSLPENQGARKFVDFLSYFENNREMIQFLWQHPYRTAAAFPLEMSASLKEKLNQFSGSWDDLARLLYEEKYFNPYVGRKPGYTQLNATALMSSLVPDSYKETIDIKNPKTDWFPAFGGKGTDRVELRLFDAPNDEYIAALQIKYIRALLNKTLNVDSRVEVRKNYLGEDFQSWKEDSGSFSQAAKTHLIELGLDPKEFLPLLVDAHQIQQVELPRPKPLEEHPDFLPLKEEPWNPTQIKK
ncbi:hypothetical protein EBT16_03050 [bacterium]|nr:hypothetical protein [bacterium]